MHMCVFRGPGVVSQSQAQGRNGYMNHKILFVDDCSTTLLMEQILFARRTDYNIIMARDGQEAIQKAVVEQPGLILMDATLPNMAACREMRKIPELQRVPIILVSSPDGPANPENGFSTGCNDGLDKPLNWRALFEMVNTYLGDYRVPR
jgi:PleD family two-component response regulator